MKSKSVAKSKKAGMGAKKAVKGAPFKKGAAVKAKASSY